MSNEHVTEHVTDPPEAKQAKGPKREEQLKRVRFLNVGVVDAPSGAGYSLSPGEEQDVTEKDAKFLIEAGLAEEV